MKKKDLGLYSFIGISIIAAYYLFFKKTGASMNKPFTPQDATDALLKIRETVGKERAQLLERILRWETNHFKSKQYQQGGSAGMEDGKWFNLPANTYTTFPMRDNLTKEMRNFIKWNSVFDFLKYLNAYIDRYNGNYARWNTLNEEGQIKYRRDVNSVRNRTIV
jgi:hypothetical protein